MTHDPLFDGAGASRSRRQPRTPVHSLGEPAAASRHDPGGPPDLDALAATLIRVAEIAEAREARLREALSEAAAQGDLKRVRQLARRLGEARPHTLAPSRGDSAPDSENPPCA